MTDRTLRVVRADGTWLDAPLPRGVEAHIIRRALDQLSAGATPTWLSQSEAALIANIVESFAQADKDKESARVAERDAASPKDDALSPGTTETPRVAGDGRAGSTPAAGTSEEG